MESTGDPLIDAELKRRRNFNEARRKVGEVGTRISETALPLIAGAADDVAVLATGRDLNEEESSKVLAAAGLLIPGVSGAEIRTGRKLVKGARALEGTAEGGKSLSRITGRWLRGTAGNAGLIPGQVAEKLRGRTFRDFDDFRQTLWKEVAKDAKLAEQFGAPNVGRMKRGLAPIAHSSQHLGDKKSYILHHRTPIQEGGGVFDLDNIVVVTPRMHNEILDPARHFGGGTR